MNGASPALGAHRIGLYLHIPFCRKKCAYCDFCSYAGRESLHEPYLFALEREVSLLAAQVHARAGRARTLYVGGGTPTALPVEALALLIEKARDAFSLLPDAEVTVEANPGTIDGASLKRLRQAGANRLSLGVQSLDDGLLRLLGRIHSAEQAERAVRDARAAGFDNLSLDLMLGLPRQSIVDWQESVERALGWQPEHLSLYALTVEPGTPLAAQIESGALEDVDDDRAADMYEWAEERLARAGYVHYEISNWAQPGHESQHNLIYWRNQPYLGLGAGAHSWYAGQRWANVGDPAAYIARLNDARAGDGSSSSPPCTVRGGQRGGGPAAVEAPSSSPPWVLRGGLRGGTAADEVIEIDVQTEMSETMMMGLRLLQEGVSDARFRQRFGVSLDEVYHDQIEAAVSEGLLEWSTECLRLTHRGHLLGNRVFVRFVGD